MLKAHWVKLDCSPKYPETNTVLLSGAVFLKPRGDFKLLAYLITCGTGLKLQQPMRQVSKMVDVGIPPYALHMVSKETRFSEP